MQNHPLGAWGVWRRGRSIYQANHGDGGGRCAGWRILGGDAVSTIRTSRGSWDPGYSFTISAEPRLIDFTVDIDPGGKRKRGVGGGEREIGP